MKAFAFLLITHFCISSVLYAQQVESWQHALGKKEGQINIHWFKSKPFIFINDQGNLEGIEYEVMEGFKHFVDEIYQVKLDIQWVETSSFQDTYDLVKNSKEAGNFGASLFSITPERRQDIAFTPPYMQDITVLISSNDVPIVKNGDEFNEVFSKLTAVTIQGTTYQKDLLLLQREKNISFDIQYIPSSEKILQTIEESEKTFAFIDLPIYLTEFKRNPDIQVKRQNLYPMKREGYSIIYPLGSDWQIPLERYFFSSAFKKQIEEIKSKYLDQDVYQFLENQYAQSSGEDILLLTKEKEIQKENLLGKTEQIRRETELRYLLIAALVIILIFLLIIFKLYQVRSNTAIVLAEQKSKIEHQHQNIEIQKIELEKRNARLTLLDEEKNELIKILAHDLRTPITHIHAFAHLLKMEKESADQPMYIEKIIDSTSRLSKMISKVLDVDALESNRDNLKIEEVNIVQIVEKILAEFEKEFIRKSLQLHFRKPKEFIIIKSDVFYLTQILENLVSNAIKFTALNKSIYIDIDDSLSEVAVTVQDEGPGLTDEDKTQLFQKYKRLSAQPTGNELSTGVGLSIVKKYADLLHAKIEYTSEVGKGTSFTTLLKKDNGSVL